MANKIISEELRDELAEVLRALPPQRVELVLATGRAYTEQALDMLAQVIELRGAA